MCVDSSFEIKWKNQRGFKSGILRLQPLLQIHEIDLMD